MARKRGPPLGNQNARKHGFYSVVLTDQERNNLVAAAAVKGLDDEITILRVKLKSVVEHDPENIELISKAAKNKSFQSRLFLRTQARLFSQKIFPEKSKEQFFLPVVGSRGVEPLWPVKPS